MSNNIKYQKNIQGKKPLNANENNINNNNINENADSNIYSIDNNEVLDNLIKLSGNQEVYKELKEETGKIKQILSQSKEKLENITLYEKQKSDIDIYQWNNLFNRSIPITAYVAPSSYIKKQNEKLLKKEENKNASETKDDLEIKHPIVLVDLTNEEMKKYLPPDPVGIPPSSVIRFQQLPFKGDSSNVFYFSNAFNDYYKMDFKEFIKRMPILKAKKRCESAKLNKQLKRTKKRSKIEDRQREIIKKKMLNRLNNLYIEKQYLSLSSNAKNIQPLMSSIHAQIYPGQGDELTKHSKIYIKTNKPLGSERDIDNIDYSVNDREYHRNELQRIKAVKKRPKSSTRAVFRLSKYDINDPDIAIFKKYEDFEKEEIEEENTDNLNKEKLLNEKQENNVNESDRKTKEENISEDTKKYNKQIINKEALKVLEENKNINNNSLRSSNYKIIQKNIKDKNIRALSAKRHYQKRQDILDINRNHNKLPRAMSAQGIRHSDGDERPFIHKVFLSSKNKAFYKNSAYRKRNKMSDNDEKNRGNSSSQISTYEGMNNSLYENQNIQRYGFPLKSSHQIQNKIYQKINKRLKERQYEKDKQKLEEFSRLIHLDDAILSDDFSKDKINNSGNNANNGLFYLEKNKLLNRPLSSYQAKVGRNFINNAKNNNLIKPLTPKILRYNKSNNNFRAISKKSSNENSKLDFTTSVLNTKHELMFNNNNDKVTLIYFNEIIENKPPKISEGKPVIKNDRIIVGANYYNRTKPQILNYKSNFRHKRNLRRVQSGKNSSTAPKLKDNVIIQEEHF